MIMEIFPRAQATRGATRLRFSRTIEVAEVKARKPQVDNNNDHVVNGDNAGGGRFAAQ